jgi:hypothetical protein
MHDQERSTIPADQLLATIVNITLAGNSEDGFYCGLIDGSLATAVTSTSTTTFTATSTSAGNCSSDQTSDDETLDDGSLDENKSWNVSFHRNYNPNYQHF